MNDFTLRALAALVLALPSTGCLSTPAAPRHEFVDPIAPVLTGPTTSFGVRLVDVTASDAARDVLTWRDGAGNVWRDDGTRFASTPADFVRRLAQRRLAGGATSRGRLDIELLYFGAFTANGGAAAEVVVFALLEDETGALVLAREYRESLPVTSPTAPGRGSAAPLAVALGAAAETVVVRVLVDAARLLGE